jgi:hypothetical protein
VGGEVQATAVYRKESIHQVISICRGDNSWPCDDAGSYYCVSRATWQSAKYAALLHEGKAAPGCTRGTCNSVNFPVLKPSDWTRGQVISIRIDGKGLGPENLIHLKLVPVTHERSSYQVFHSFYKEMRSKFSISAKAKNLLLSLAESIAQTLNVTSCYDCEVANMRDHWAWEKDDKWPPEQIIQYYVPATWAKDSPGAIAPLYICSTTSSGCRLLLKL